MKFTEESPLIVSSARRFATNFNDTESFKNLAKRRVENLLKQLFHSPLLDARVRVSLLDAVYCGTDSENQVSNGSHIGLFSPFISSPFSANISTR